MYIYIYTHTYICVIIIIIIIIIIIMIIIIIIIIINIYIYIYILPPSRSAWRKLVEVTGTRRARLQWVFITGGCSGRGMQWMGVVLDNKLVHNSIQITTPCFHCNPL